jgi:predicted DNA-binding transcriptional regulator AlpA
MNDQRDIEQRWLTTEQASVYGGFSTPKAYWEWSKRHKVPKSRAGRRLRWLREDIDQALKPTDWSAYFATRKRA